MTGGRGHDATLTQPLDSPRLSARESDVIR